MSAPFHIIPTKRGFDVWHEVRGMIAEDVSCYGDAVNWVEELQEADKAARAKPLFDVPDFSAPPPVPARLGSRPIDEIYTEVNALGGWVDTKDPAAVARNELLGEVLDILEAHGAVDARDYQKKDR